MNKILIKVNVAGLLKGVKKDGFVSVEVDEKGTPFDLFWVKRIRDSKIDNCVTIIQDEKPKKKVGGNK
jgi:hypothetical protein